MKNYVTKVLLASSFLIVGGVTAATAQVDGDAIFRVNVPFSFNVREKAFPAGEYLIRIPDNPTNTGLMEIESVKGKNKAAIFDTFPITVNTAPTEANLIFGKIQDKYFLSEIWQDNNTGGNQVEEPGNMKKLEKSGVKKEKMVIRAEMSRKK